MIIRSETKNGILYHKDGKLHNDNDHPAVISDEGEFWYQNGKMHRDNAHAAENRGGARFWCQNGLLHREDGPAIYNTINPGVDGYYLNGECVSKELHDAHRTKSITIAGVKYSLVRNAL